MGQYTLIGVSSMKGNTTLFKLSNYYVLRQIIRNGSLIERGSIVKTDSRLWFLFPVKNVGAVTILLLCSFSDDALYCTKFCENISTVFKVTEKTIFSKLKFSKGIIPLKMSNEFWFLISVHRLMMLYIWFIIICTKVS